MDKLDCAIADYRVLLNLEYIYTVVVLNETLKGYIHCTAHLGET